MNDEKKYLVVIRDLDRDMVIIVGNYKGLLSLKKHIESLLNVKEECFKDGKIIDVNLMTPELGGEELSDQEPFFKDRILVGHLRICRWEDHMNDKKNFLRVVRDLKKEMVTIDGNYEGLLLLHEYIDSLLNIKEKYFKDGRPEDVDLMIPDWGGEELDEEEPAGDCALIGHLRIYRFED